MLLCRPARLAAAVLVASSVSAFARTLPATQTAAGQGGIEAAPAPVTDPVTLAALEALGRHRPAARGEMEAGWIEMLGKVYASKSGTLLWWSQQGATTAATALADEIRRADDYGLESKAFDLPDLGAVGTGMAARAEADVKLSLAAIKYAWHAAGGRVDPSQLSLWLDQWPQPVDVAALVSRLTEATDPAGVLRDLNPTHPQFERLRQKLIEARAPRIPTPTPVVEAAAPVPPAPAPATMPPSVPSALPAPPAVQVPLVPPGPRLVPGVIHPDIEFVRVRLGVPTNSFDRDRYDARLVRAVNEFEKSAGRKPKLVIDDSLRDLLNGSPPPVLVQTLAPPLATKPRPTHSKTSQRQPSGPDIKRLLVNMERWRWLPRDMGALHVWNNLPEFETRVVRDGRTIHQERIIIGKPDTQTPVFSDRMRFVVFNPDWGVPPSIKVKDLLHRLQDGDEDVLERRNMRIVINGKVADPGKINWDKVDIRQVPIVQGPGRDNPLGTVKFMFPNKHDVYMHDTPSKGLFGSSVRTFSHGCIRVRNPRKLAELVFGADRGWSAADVAGQFAEKPTEPHKVDLQQSIPVHNTYFTMLVEADGTLRTFADVYGHDRRIAAVLLDGKPAALVAKDDPALRLQREIDELAPPIKPKPVRWSVR
jgi:murein L,D-transpeptidase YcbB/YkuD